MTFKIKISVLLVITYLTLSQSRSYQSSNNDLVIELAKPSSKIRGHILQSDSGNNFFAFQDIPYAESPIGKNRFRPPAPVDSWDGILETTSNKRICPQGINPFVSVSKSKQLKETEDCLVLNVYTPAKPGSNSSLPVLFWIHGGAWLGGSGNAAEYNPKYLIDYDIVIVTINYRLGAFGFLTTDDEHLPGNLGYRDQHFALQWVNDNIHVFGGDPKKITVGGESAGSIGSGMQLLTPLNKGLMRGVMQSSSSAFSTFGYQQHYKKWAFKMGKALDSSFNSTSSKDLLEILQNASEEDIFKVQTDIQRESDDYVGYMIELIWTPIIESGPDAIVTENMHGNFINGNFNLVPLFIGFNSEEALLFYNGSNTDAFAIASKRYDDDARLLISEKLHIAEEHRETLGKALKKLYTRTLFSEDQEAFVRYTSDEVFVRSLIRQAETASKYVSVYLYELSWEAVQGEIPGVEHGNDLVYIWQDPATSMFPFDKDLRKPLLKLWTNFIKLQNPTPVEDEDLQNIKWPTVDPNGYIRYLNINKTFEILENPRQYSKMREILDPYLQPPYNVY